MEFFAEVEWQVFRMLGFNQALVFGKHRFFEGEEAGDIFNRSILRHKEEYAGVPGGNWRCGDEDRISTSREHIWESNPGGKRNSDVVGECLDGFAGRSNTATEIVHLHAARLVNNCLFRDLH